MHYVNQLVVTHSGVATYLRYGGICNNDYRKFNAESVGERMKIGQHLAKLRVRV